MEKITKRAINKIGSIVEIIMVILNTDYTSAFLLVRHTETGKAIIEGDMATMYQSAACCTEDIGREFRANNNPVANYFTDDNINKAIDIIRLRNQQNLKRYKQMVV